MWLEASGECPLIPMGAITGSPSREFLTETLRSWREVGITQFMIYARSGGDLEYMSEAWLDVCEWICIEAERLAFSSIWLYDEYNWPSGTCARRILTENPDHALRLLCAYPAGDGHALVIRRSSLISDLFSVEVVDRFIELTHARYEKRLSRYMGNLLKGFFTDEPDISSFCSLQHREDVIRIPWYDTLEQEYRRETGGELRADILRGLATGSKPYEEVCNRLYAEKFRNNFARRISNWCADRGLLLTGHLMDEYSAANALARSGHPLRVLSAFSLPGMDEIFTHTTTGSIEWLTLGTAMYAIEQQGNRGGLAELFALGPCDMTLERMRKQIWLCAAFGVSRYVLAISPLTMKGNVEKNSYFNAFTRTQPWFPAFRELGEDAGLAAEFASKKRTCEIAVRYAYTPEPLTDLLKHLTAGQFQWKLILPEEESDAKMILAPGKGGLLEERSGRTFPDFQSLEETFSSTMPRGNIVLENGKPAWDIFIRSYEDGTALVINLSAEKRTLVLTGNGLKTPFILFGNGVRSFGGAPPLPDMPETGAIALPERLMADSPNTCRADFETGTFRFTLTDDLEELTLAVRREGDLPELLLDGQPIQPDRPCEALPQGFRELYRETAPFSLHRGTHLLTQMNQAKDYRYLPTAFLLGRFSRRRDAELSAWRNNPAPELYGYVGKLIQEARITVPDASAFVLEKEELCTEVFLDGESQGRRLWHPFVWVIPEDKKGKEADLKIVRHTSCGPLFGEKAFENAEDSTLNFYRPQNQEAIAALPKIGFFREN